MKLRVNHFNEEVFKGKLKDLENIPFTLFIDDIPKSQDDLSQYNILVLQEPNEYFGLHDWAIQNKNLFTFILTWDDKVLSNCSNAIFLPFGHTWFKPDQYRKNFSKEFKLAHLSGELLKTYGHSMRHELLSREGEIKLDTKFYKKFGNRQDIEDARLGKETVFSDAQFNVAIENTQHRGYFTEKILDCFLLKSIPVYWGCSNIGDYFDVDGIITFTCIDDLIYKVNNLKEDYYETKREVIEKNYNLALQYVDYEQSIVDYIERVFKLNQLV
jgi:hypothetical protein